MKTKTTVAQGIVLLEMMLEQEEPTLDVDSTTGEKHEFVFTAYTYLKSTDEDGLYLLQPTDDSPAGGITCQWVMDYPLDRVIPFKVRQEHMSQDIAQALEGLPTQFHQAANECAKKAFEELKTYSQEPISDTSTWFAH